MARRTSRLLRKPGQVTAPATNEPVAQDNGEVIAHDDQCAICHALLYKPVTTKCHHTMCESCMNLWAEISINQQIAIVSLDEHHMTLHPSELEIKCPMCRTSSTAAADADREALLRSQYPQTYALRGAEEQTAVEGDLTDVESLTLYVGNTHQLVKHDDDDGNEYPNKHDWKFFVRPSRNDLIEEVHVYLVRTN
jgi:hypothetical protein